MKQVKFFLLIAVISLLSGCAATSEKWKGLNFGNHDSATITHSYSLKWVDEAALKVLDKMEIIIIENVTSPDGNIIKAATLDQDIFIELKSLAPSSTHMKIDIKWTDSRENHATTDEIIEKTHQYLLANAEIEPSDLVKQLDFKEENIPAK